MTQQRAPDGLGGEGRKLWKSIASVYELDPRELSLLAAACRQADDVAALEAVLARDGMIVAGSAGQPRLSAVVAELRQARLAVGKLLDLLTLPDVDAAPRVSRRSQRAAQRRWGA